MRHISLRIPFIVFLSLLTIVSCTPPWHETTTVGVLRVTPTAELDLLSQHIAGSIKMALEDIQGQGSLGNGRRLKLIVHDIPIVKDTPEGREQIRAVVNEFISREQPAALMTSVPDTAAFEIASLAESRGIPLLVHVAPAERITEQGWKYVFRLNPPTSEYSNGLLHFLSVVVKPKTFAYLYVEGPLDPLREEPERFDNEKNSGMQPVFTRRYLRSTTDFRPILKQMKKTNPDVVYMISYPRDSVLLLHQCRELDIHPKLFVGFAAFASPEFSEQAGDTANYVYAATLWSPSLPFSGAMEYYDRYLKRYGTPPDYQGAVAYAAMQVVADGFRRARSTSPRDLREALASTDMMTILGRVKFVSYGKKTQQNRLRSYLLQWLDGKPRTVWPPQFASHRYVYPVPEWKGRDQATGSRSSDVLDRSRTIASKPGSSHPLSGRAD
jgi:branched-chain amino acid transport system substrate-binding protein